MALNQHRRFMGDTAIISTTTQTAAAALRSIQGRRILLICILLLVMVGGWVFADWYQCLPADAVATYVGRPMCVSCHQQEAELFHGSHHDLAMDLATEDTVLAQFDGQQIEHFGVTSRVYRDGPKFMVYTEGPDGTMQDFEVKYVFGYHPLQQYMVELERPAEAADDEIGRVQVLRLSWDTDRRRWFYLSPPDVDEKLEPTDPLHWTGITQCWNTSCADCHSTNLKRNFDPLTKIYRTTFDEIDVSCEACHGPGSLHVQLAHGKGLFWDRRLGYGVTRLGGDSDNNIPQIESCAPCHSRRSAIAADFRPGCRYDDFFALQLPNEQLYFADGQIRDEVYVYGSFLQSKMCQQDIRCSDCHDSHSAKVKFNDNRLCTSCHQHPAAQYDTIAHHFHEPDSPGSLCVECHMPATTYMAVDPRRDHSLRIPRPDLSVRFGTPNACTGCHLDKTTLTDKPRRPITQYLDWLVLAEQGDAEIQSQLERVNREMAEATQKWYPAENSPPKSVFHEQLAAGSAAAGGSPASLQELTANRAAPAILRAAAVSRLADVRTPESLAAAIKATQEADPKIVSAALSRIDVEIARIADRAQYSSSPLESISRLEPLVKTVAGLLDHPSHRVRIDAARTMAGVSLPLRQRFADARQRRAFDNALNELLRSLTVDRDRASTQIRLGGIYELLGDEDRAIQAYRQAIGVEPNLAGPRSNLAALLESTARRLQDQVQDQLRQAGGAMADLQATLQRIDKLTQQTAELRRQEHELLKTDIQRSQDLLHTHGLHYRFAMSSFLQQDLEATERHLQEALQQQPTEPTYLLGLATFYVQQKKPARAAQYVNQLIEIDPQHPGYRALAEQLSLPTGTN